MQRFVLFWFLGTLLLFSCRKQSGLDGNARLSLSADSVYFDTLFTSVGAVTQQVTLLNPNAGILRVSSISLAGGSASPFIININGAPGPDASDLSIASNDSLYIFVTVRIRSGTNPSAFILRDSIRIQYNGTDQFIQLSAWGQNAHFLTRQVIRTNTVWPNDLPYVILGGLTVDSNATLTIEAGVHVYMHADAPLYIAGSLKALGDSADLQRIHFNGDRLDQPYADYPGSWPGIYFLKSSQGNELDYVTIQNANHGIVAEGPAPDASPKLILNQCRIRNSLNEGILGIQTRITAVNCLVNNCGQNVVLGSGGDYQFQYCTIASYSTATLSHQQPVLTVSNFGTDGTQILSGNLQAVFTNCIIWGSDGVANEALILNQATTIFHVLFDHSILKQRDFPSGIDSSSLQLNADPAFVATGSPGNRFDFHLAPGSPAINRGTNLGIPIDLDGRTRPADKPDIGCYERQ